MCSPERRVNEKEETWVSELRGRGLGARRIQNELVRQHKFHVSLRTIHKTLQRLKMTPRKRKRRGKESRRYEREIPGDRVQIDNMKIREDLHQYTAIDDCTRLKTIRLYPAKLYDLQRNFHRKGERMNDAARMRFEWIRLYEQIGNAGIVCNRCGISRPTLRKWLKRYKAEGEAGLESQSRKPMRSPGRRVNEKEEGWVSELRGRGLRARRIQNELVRQHKFHVSLRTIHKTLQRLKMTPRKRKRRNKESRRYEREIPGDRVQIDNMKIREDLHQYTAIDDCTRLKIIRLYPAKSAQNTSHFVDIVIQELPFPIQRIQTDRGQEFFAYEVQDKLRSKRIKFRPIPPASPHLNGKVERAQRTDWDEFYTSADLNCKSQ